MDNINALTEFPFFDEILIGLGAVLVLWGVLRILSSSIKLVGWVVVAGLGVMAVMIGLDRSEIAFPNSLAEELKSLTEPGKEMSVDALRALCANLPARLEAAAGSGSGALRSKPATPKAAEPDSKR